MRGPITPFFAYSSTVHPLSVVRTEYVGDDAVLVAFGADSHRLDPNDSDPYSRETWLMQRPYQLTRYLAAQQKAEGVLHFASSDIANLWAGFIDGAVESALRVSREITRHLVPQHTDAVPAV